MIFVDYLQPSIFWNLPSIAQRENNWLASLNPTPGPLVLCTHIRFACYFCSPSFVLKSILGCKQMSDSALRPNSSLPLPDPFFFQVG